MAASQESFMFTVGKLDAGMAILLGERAHLIEFPSLLLPPGATTGSIVNIAVHRNVAEEKKRDSDFWLLQNDILDTFGTLSPHHPNLELRSVTQTSVTLEWPPLQLATAKIRSLDLYRDRQRVAAIPSPLTNTSTKVSGLQVATEYSFQLVLRTSAGVFPSTLLRVRTHTMTDTSGIVVCFGTVQDELLLENAKTALRDMGAKWSDKIQIDTTHFVCTTPAATPSGAAATNSLASGPGVEYQKALQLSIPVVQPHWILACHSEKKMLHTRAYYLGQTPPSLPPARPQSMSQANLSSPSQPSATSSPPQQKHANRQSMPPQRVTPSSPPASSSPSVGRATPQRIAEEAEVEDEDDDERLPPGDDGHEEPRADGDDDDDDDEHAGRTRKGTMSKNFRFPPPGTDQPPPVPPVISITPSEETEAAVARQKQQHEHEQERPPLTPPKAEDPASATDHASESDSVAVVAPSSVQVPPPPPVDKERPSALDVDDDVGDTEEISLN